jgi:hypothetical protein
MKGEMICLLEQGRWSKMIKRKEIKEETKMKNNKMTKEDKKFMIKEIVKEIIQHLLIGIFKIIGFIAFLLAGIFVYCMVI